MNLDGHNAYIAAAYLIFFVTMAAIVFSTVMKRKNMQRNLEILKAQLEQYD